MVKITDKGPVERNEADASHSASLVYRDKDGHPHMVPAQEEAARDAQREERRKPDLPPMIPTAPD